MQLKKSAIFTDIHFGAKTNSEQHNQDCITYLVWFCDRVKQDPTIDHVLFLGDWNQERNAIDILTLKYSHEGASMLNDLGIPVYFILGNHDLYKRHSREIHSIVHFETFNNFVQIYEPTVVDEIGNGVMLCPFLFHDEYSTLSQYADIKFWAGHFEFAGFVITGHNTKMKGGPDPKDFTKPTILSGHFHKRQTEKNITYIGNCFPTNFGDAGDVERGLATYDHKTETLDFINWEECPKYISTTLSALLEDPSLADGARVKCTVDIPIDYSEGSIIRKKFMDDFNLRAFSLEETAEIREALAETEVDDDIVEIKTTNTNEMVCEMLDGIETKHIDSDLLIAIYQDLQPDTDD